MIPAGVRAQVDERVGDPRAVEQWMAAHLPAAEAMERITREILDGHTEWDSPHTFTAITWDGTHPAVASVAVLDPAIHPNDYLRVLQPAVAGLLADRMTDPASAPIVGFTLQVEAYTVAEDTLAPEQREAVARHEIHTLPQAAEACFVMTADITGRLWCARNTRGTNEQAFNNPDDLSHPITGRLTQIVRLCSELLPLAYVTAGHRS